MKSLIVGMVWVFAMTMPGSIMAQEASVIQADIRSETKRELSAEESRAISLAAGRILKHVHQAQMNLIEGDFEKAGNNVEKARLLFDIIEKAAPVYKTEARIQAGDLVYEDTDQIQRYLITVYDELAPVSILAPVIQAQRAVLLETGRVPAQFDFTRVYFDAALADEHLETAAIAIEEENAETAARALLAIQLAVYFEFRRADLPLSEASRNVMMAKSLYEDGRIDESREALQEAAQALEFYAKNGGKKNVEEITKVQDQILSLSSGLEKGQPAARQQLMQIWDQIVSWYGY